MSCFDAIYFTLALEYRPLYYQDPRKSEGIRIAWET
jgi:hypothetical protein